MSDDELDLAELQLATAHLRVFRVRLERALALLDGALCKDEPAAGADAEPVLLGVPGRSVVHMIADEASGRCGCGGVPGRGSLLAPRPLAEVLEANPSSSVCEQCLMRVYGR